MIDRPISGKGLRGGVF